MSKTIKIVKIVVASIILLILLLCCNVLDWIPIPWVKSLLTDIGVVLNDKSVITFTILLMLCFIYVIFDIYKFCYTKLTYAEAVDQLEELQADYTENTNSSFSLVDKAIKETNDTVINHKNQVNIKIIKHKSHIQHSFDMIKIKHSNNSLSYHLNTKRLYKIVRRTKIGQQISDVIEKYISQS